MSEHSSSVTPADAGRGARHMERSRHRACGAASSAAGLVSQVHPVEQIRTQAEAASRRPASSGTDLNLDRELYAISRRARRAHALDDEAASGVLEHTLRDFRRAGVDQRRGNRQRLPRAFAERETLLGQEFSKNIRDDVRTVVARPRAARRPARRLRRATTRPARTARSLITTDYPDDVPVPDVRRTTRAARRELMLAFINRAWPRQRRGAPRAARRCAREQPACSGYAGWPDFDAEVKMIGAGDAIAAVHRRDHRGG